MLIAYVMKFSTLGSSDHKSNIFLIIIISMVQMPNFIVGLDNFT